MSGQGLVVAMMCSPAGQRAAAAVDPAAPGYRRGSRHSGFPPAPAVSLTGSDLDELDARQIAELAPGGGVVAEVHHLVVRPARGQPPVHAAPYPGRGAE